MHWLLSIEVYGLFPSSSFSAPRRRIVGCILTEWSRIGPKPSPDCHRDVDDDGLMTILIVVLLSFPLSILIL